MNIATTLTAAEVSFLDKMLNHHKQCSKQVPEKVEEFKRKFAPLFAVGGMSVFEDHKAKAMLDECRDDGRNCTLLRAKLIQAQMSMAGSDLGC